MMYGVTRTGEKLVKLVIRVKRLGVWKCDVMWVEEECESGVSSAAETWEHVVVDLFVDTHHL